MATKLYFTDGTPKEMTKEDLDKHEWFEIGECPDYWSPHQNTLNTWENNYNCYIDFWFPSKEIVTQNFIYWQWSVGEKLSRIRTIDHLETILGKESISRYL